MTKICKASLPDLDKITGIGKICLTENRAISREYFERKLKERSEGFITAECEGQIAGFGIGELKTDSAKIILLAVSSNFRQKGIGTVMVNHLIEYFKKQGAKKIFLHVRILNQPAVDFYQRLGFKILETIKKYYRNGDDAYLMKLKI